MKIHNYIKTCTQQQIYLQRPKLTTQNIYWQMEDAETYYVRPIQWNISQHKKGWIQILEMDEPQKHFDRSKKQGTKITSYLNLDRQHFRIQGTRLICGDMLMRGWDSREVPLFNLSSFLFWTLGSTYFPLSLVWAVSDRYMLSPSPKYALIPPVVSFLGYMESQGWTFQYW